MTTVLFFIFSYALYLVLCCHFCLGIFRAVYCFNSNNNSN